MIGSNGLALDRQGRLVIATWAGRSIVRVEKNGTRTVLADRWEGKRFGGTNDVVVKKDGAIYFTDTYGGLRLRDKDPAKELDFNAVYMWKDGKLSLLIKDIPNTNGLAFSPDEKILYVNGSRDRYVKAYDVKADDTLANGRMLIDMDKRPGAGHHRRRARRREGQPVGDRPGRRVDHHAGRQAHRHHQDAGAVRQRRVRRPRPQDALHRGAHRHLQDPPQRGRHSGGEVGVSLNPHPLARMEAGSAEIRRKDDLTPFHAKPLPAWHGAHGWSQETFSAGIPRVRSFFMAS